MESAVSDLNHVRFMLFLERGNRDKYWFTNYPIVNCHYDCICCGMNVQRAYSVSENAQLCYECTYMDARCCKW